ncbi:hypothetical protein PPYR_13506 [Photinus pyralis]|uniref:BRCA1-associated ATM activator 1 n=1 Tax=Photinus pyralis TaxID=7054 RepID=A0A1Y1M8B4_PHOPY|nr:uncharacterized protein LOC116178143 [Photinus pyralis]KAB0793886.1 hypothetical protein PPYR_13506 [Photinus pyralis]
MDTDLNVVQYEEKLKRLLTKLLDQDFVITSDTYLNTLLSHLSGKDNKELGASLLALQIFTEWLVNATKYWEETGLVPSAKIANFTFILASLLSCDEDKFNQLNVSNLYIRLFTVLKVRSSSTLPLIKLSYIKLLSSFLEHRSGVSWLIATDNWHDVIRYSLENQTTYVSKEGYNFVCNTLAKGSQFNQVFCSMVVEKIMGVFTEMTFTNGVVNDESLQGKMTPSLQLIGTVLESCLKSELFTNGNYDIPSLFLKNFHLEQNMCNVIMLGSQNEKLFEDINRVMILVHFCELAIDSDTKIFQRKRIKKLVEQIYKLITLNLTKGFVSNIPKMCYLLQYYWKLIESRLPGIDCNSDEAQIMFETQIAMIQMFPVCNISYKVCGVSVEQCFEDYFRDQFATKVVKTLCEHTIRLLYNYRTALLNDKIDIFNFVLMSTSYLMKSRNWYNRDRGVIVFQFYMYILNDVITTMKSKPNMVDTFTKQVSFFTITFDVLSVFIQQFDITWRESVETICVMGTAIDIINVACWPSKLVVQALKLVNLAISRFMPPNLALLVDGTTEMERLGRMVTSKLHDLEWEVRDSALEVLHTIASISHTKYPAFQSIITDLEFPLLTITVAMHDSESYVRASAIKCLQEMIQVSSIWTPILQQQDLPSKMMQILYNETEAVVRCEAARLMSVIYEHRSFPKSSTEVVYEAMVFAATTDLDWEVRENALEYWGKVINMHLTDQGMIDGTFPSVTFSKENRKIVTLTDAEIKRRLNKVLNELSDCGCLGVLVACMHEDCDIKVLRKSVEITQTLSRLLRSYNIIEDSPASPDPPTVLEAFNIGDDLKINSYSDKVVNDIVNSRDIGLLVNVFKNENDFVSPSTVKMVQRKTSPKEFLTFVQRDLNKLLVERTNWLRQIDDLGSLLDDILKCYNNDINVMDCY